MGRKRTISLSIENIRKACGKPNEKLTREDINMAIAKENAEAVFVASYKLTDSGESTLSYYFIYGTEFQSLELEMDMEKLQSCSSLISYISPRGREAMGLKEGGLGICAHSEYKKNINAWPPTPRASHA